MTTKPFRPMLARAHIADEQLPFPLITSPKLDGVRCLVIDGVPTSRSLKPLPNKSLADYLPWRDLNGLDGELIVGDPTAPDAYNRTTSALMSHDGALDGLRFHVFDCFAEPEERYTARLIEAANLLDSIGTEAARLLPMNTAQSAEELHALEELAVEAGYEGLMLRAMRAPYKYGRTSSKEHGLLKLKRFEDGEATILRVHPLMRNGNAAQLNELGLTERSTKKANMVPDELLGCVDVRDLQTQVEFSIGSGFDLATRQMLWVLRDTLPGQLMKYKYQPAGVKEAPRFPVYQGIRSPLDM